MADEQETQEQKLKRVIREGVSEELDAREQKRIEEEKKKKSSGGLLDWLGM